jgi:allantoate deiminase
MTGAEALPAQVVMEHDAVTMSSLADVGMLFVRCQAGLSHHPAESVSADDVGVAIETLGRFLELLARP